MSIQNVNKASLAMLNETFIVIFKRCVTFFQDQKPVKRDIIFLQEMHLVFKRHLTHCMGCLVLPNFSSFFSWKRKMIFALDKKKKEHQTNEERLLICKICLDAFYWPFSLLLFWTLLTMYKCCSTHTIRKVKFLSKNSILTKPQIFFDNFSREIKVVNS